MELDFQTVKNGAKNTYNALNDNIAINAFRSGVGKSLRLVYNKCSGVAVSDEVQVNADRVMERHVDYFVNKGINPLNIAAFTLSHDTPVGMAAYGLVTTLEMGTAIASTRRAKQGELDQEPLTQWIGTRSLLAAGLVAVAYTQGLNVAEAWNVLKDDLANIRFFTAERLVWDDMLEMALHSANAVGALYVAASKNLWQRDVYTADSQVSEVKTKLAM